jgi:hypothetical protein
MSSTFCGAKCLGVPEDNLWGVVINAGVTRNGLQRNIEVAVQKDSEPEISLYCATELWPMARIDIHTARDKSMLLECLSALSSATKIQLNQELLIEKFGFAVFTNMWPLFESRGVYEEACASYVSWQSSRMDEDLISEKVKTLLTCKRPELQAWPCAVDEEEDKPILWLCSICSSENDQNSSSCMVCAANAPTRKCRSCGLLSKSWDKSCNHCHHSFSDDTSLPSQEITLPVQDTQHPPDSTSTRGKDKAPESDVAPSGIPEGWKEYKITPQQVEARQNLGRAVGASYYHNATLNLTKWNIADLEGDNRTACDIPDTMRILQGTYKGFIGYVISSVEYSTSSGQMVLSKARVETLDNGQASKRGKGNTGLRNQIAQCFDDKGNLAITTAGLLSSLVAKGMLAQMKKAGEVQRMKIKELALEMLIDHYTSLKHVGFELFRRHPDQVEIRDDAAKLEQKWKSVPSPEQRVWKEGNIPGEAKTTKRWPSAYYNDDSSIELTVVSAGILTSTNLLSEAVESFAAMRPATFETSRPKGFVVGAMVSAVSSSPLALTGKIGCIRSVSATQDEATIFLYTGAESPLPTDVSLIGRKVRVSMQAASMQQGGLLPGGWPSFPFLIPFA